MVSRANCYVENYSFIANKVTALLEINSQLYCGELKFHLVETGRHAKTNLFFIALLKILPHFFYKEKYDLGINLNFKSAQTFVKDALSTKWLITAIKNAMKRWCKVWNWLVRLTAKFVSRKSKQTSNSWSLSYLRPVTRHVDAIRTPWCLRVSLKCMYLVRRKHISR